MRTAARLLGLTQDQPEEDQDTPRALAIN